MELDLNFSGGFVLNVADDMDDNKLDELIQQIESEANAALNMVAYKYGLGCTGVELCIDD